MVTVQPELMAALRECCSYRAPAVILSPDLGLVCHARFAAFTPPTVELEISGGIQPPPGGSACCVSFVHAPVHRAFFARVLDHKRGVTSDIARLTLEVSSESVGIEARMAYRVPIVKAHELKARVFTKTGQVLLPKPIDLSLSGSLIEFSPEEDPDFPVGTVLNLQLISPKEIVELKAEVRRRKGHRYGMFFPEVVGAQGINPPEALRIIIENLERNRLQERIR